MAGTAAGGELRASQSWNAFVESSGTNLIYCDASFTIRFMSRAASERTLSWWRMAP